MSRSAVRANRITDFVKSLTGQHEEVFEDREEVRVTGSEAQPLPQQFEHTGTAPRVYVYL